MASGDRSLHFSDGFVISCGTVTVDVDRLKMLLIRCRDSGEVYLPKGRKDMDESLQDAALRETWEETGVRAELMRLRITTRATIPANAAAAAAAVPITSVTEPLAVSQRMSGILKIIFWFVAAADSTAAREEATQQEGEDFEALWMGWDEAITTLTFDDDRRIAEAAVLAMATKK
ncbi:hypothetical protein V2A60_001272 [Cordyceps javanica]